MFENSEEIKKIWLNVISILLSVMIIGKFGQRLLLNKGYVVYIVLILLVFAIRKCIVILFNQSIRLCSKISNKNKAAALGESKIERKL